MRNSTPAAKTAISVAPDILERITRVAADRHQSRSAVIEDALRAFLYDLESRELTESFNRAYNEPMSDEDRAFLERAAHETFKRLNELDGGWGHS